jgi:uncharacterized metal-binding protein YceD (DUF177 family)
MIKSDEPEFSRPLPVDKIPQAGVEQRVEASEAERKKLEARFGLLSLASLRAEVSVKPKEAGRLFEASGRLKADLVQQCVVTLEPIPAHLEQDIDVLYMAKEWTEPDATTTQIALEDEETEAIQNGVIDLGELVAQEFGAALDPYPRKPGLAWVEAEYGGEKEKTPNPFAKLAEFTKKPESKDR